MTIRWHRAGRSRRDRREHDGGPRCSRREAARRVGGVQDGGRLGNLLGGQELFLGLLALRPQPATRCMHGSRGGHCKHEHTRRARAHDGLHVPRGQASVSVRVLVRVLVRVSVRVGVSARECRAGAGVGWQPRCARPAAVPPAAVRQLQMRRLRKVQQPCARKKQLQNEHSKKQRQKTKRRPIRRQQQLRQHKSES